MFIVIDKKIKILSDKLTWTVVNSFRYGELENYDIERIGLVIAKIIFYCIYDSDLFKTSPSLFILI